LYWKQLYHNSCLTGYGWVQELIHSHPDCIQSEHGVRLHVFVALVEQLQALGIENSRNITLEKQAAIFLYISVTGLSLRHVAEQFQHANDTIS
ncbi:hypothetical protein GYMLUDRAFT_112338, partial [Collybiopsis luxurians FD-317 M1]